MVFRTLNGLMTALFLLAVLVQYNDPDPVRWMAIYGAACALAAVVAVQGRAPLMLIGAVGLVAFGWSLTLVVGIPNLAVYGSMFDAWEMKSATVEEAREASGLLIVAAWMAVLAGRARLRARP